MSVVVIEKKIIKRNFKEILLLKFSYTELLDNTFSGSIYVEVYDQIFYQEIRRDMNAPQCTDSTKIFQISVLENYIYNGFYTYIYIIFATDHATSSSRSSIEVKNAWSYFMACTGRTSTFYLQGVFQ